ncbi:hypothetical protein LUZ60_001720 [Juncus effusus]|nr:hypothetical protein LUZ60_001720 [Juncus effusus]
MEQQQQKQDQVEIPSYYLCPISLQLMKDPVTLCTGITYDRSSIEKWLDTPGPYTCPMTRQPLTDGSLTPNHTLRRLIQSWCTANSAHGYEAPPTPKPPVDQVHVLALLASANEAATRVESLREIKKIVSESDTNRKCVESTPGLITFLASLIHEQNSLHEALSILSSLHLSENKINEIVEKYSDIVDSLMVILQSKLENHTRLYAVQFLKSIAEHISPDRIVNVNQELFQELVYLLRDRVAIKPTLYVLASLCPFGRNRIKAVRVGSIPILIDLLLDEPERRICELGFVVLDRLCGCAEGRAELAGHAAGIAIVERKMLRVSQLVNDRAVRILSSIAKHVPTPSVLNEMMQVGAVGKICTVLQSEDCGGRAKEKALEILKLHVRVWRNSPCLLPHFLSLYPSC